MKRLIIFGATGSLGRHAVRLALDGEHDVTVLVRAPSKLSPEIFPRVSVRQGDLATLSISDIAQFVEGHDAFINCAGTVTEGQRFVDLVDHLVGAVESLSPPARPVCWFLAGAGLLDIGASGRRGIDLPAIHATYWPHKANFERLSRTDLDWRLLCPGPMVDEPALGLDRLRVTVDTLPVDLPDDVDSLPGPALLPILGSAMPQMIVPYADAAALMLAHLDRGDTFARHRVGLALPRGMRGTKSEWMAKPPDAS